MKTKLVFVVVIVILIVVVAGVLLMSSHVGSPTNEKIEIPQEGAQVLGGGKYATLTVHNMGSVAVTIATIYVNDVAYNYSSTPALGTFSASSSQISPGQSVTFTITPTTTLSSQVFMAAVLHFKAVTTNGAEAKADVSHI